MPTDFGELREVAGCPHSGIAPRQRMIEFLDPTRNNPLDIEVSVCEVPFGMGDDLDLSSADIPVKMRHSLSHGFSGVFFIQGVRCHPETEFMILQSRFEIRNQQVNQAGFGLVKLAEVSAPRCLLHASDSHRSQLFLHRRYLMSLNTEGMFRSGVGILRRLLLQEIAIQKAR